MVGRGLRSSPGKCDCIVLDQSGNTLVHGPIVGPDGYVPEPWGDDCDKDKRHSKGKLSSKSKLVRLRVLLPQHMTHSVIASLCPVAQWKLSPCAGSCGVMLHVGVRLCHACLRARVCCEAPAEARRVPLADKTNVATATAATAAKKPVPSAPETTGLTESETSLLDIVIPRKPRATMAYKTSLRNVQTILFASILSFSTNKTTSLNYNGATTSISGVI